jgi:hypothetical protein
VYDALGRTDVRLSALHGAVGSAAEQVAAELNVGDSTARAEWPKVMGRLGRSFVECSCAGECGVRLGRMRGQGGFGHRPLGCVARDGPGSRRLLPSRSRPRSPVDLVIAWCLL